MARTMQREVKSAPVGMPPDDEIDQMSDEPWGAQVLRRLHQDAAMLMQEYDQMMGPLERSEVQKRLQRKLEDMESELSDIEGMFGKIYKDLPGLEGMKDLTEDEVEDIAEDLVEEEADTEEDDAAEEKDMDTMDDAAVPAEGNTEEDEPKPSEAVEGMRKKKSLKVRKKGMCAECGKEDCKCGTKVAPALAAAIPAIVGAVAGGSLESHEKRAVGEAAGFLGEVEGAQEWADEHRMMSFHYHKTMEGIGALEEAQDDLEQTPTESDVPPAEFEPGAGAKSEPGSEEWEREEMEEPEHQDKMSHRKMCQGASGFFKVLSQTSQLSDEHRMKAGQMKAALEPLSREEEAEEDPQEMQEVEPGEMDMKSLEEMIAQQERDLQELEKLTKELVQIA